MVTCKVDTVAVPKMNSIRTRKPSSSNSSGIRLLEGDHLETSSSVSRNSIYKLKIDLMYDDTRSVRNNRLDDPRGSHRTRSIIMYGRSELASTAGESSRSITSFLQDSKENSKVLADTTKKDVQRISNSVQAQIEQLFTDVAKDATSSFAVTCLGSLPLKDKVTSLQGLQQPLRDLYLKEKHPEERYSGFLDICATGLRIKMNAISYSPSNYKTNVNKDENITPFHNIAVWSAVKFVVSEEDGGAAFLPLITDPQNIDKSLLFEPLSPAAKNRFSNSSHSPIFAVVMRSAGLPKVLECHGFICKSTEDAIVIAATLYQSLMAHVHSDTHRSNKRRTPRNQNGVSCISIASSSALTGSNYLTRSQVLPSGRKSSFRSSNGSITGPPTSARSTRKKRIPSNSLGASSNVINEIVETSTEERKRSSYKSKRAPPIPTITHDPLHGNGSYKTVSTNNASKAYLDNFNGSYKNSSRLKNLSDKVYCSSNMIDNEAGVATSSSMGMRNESNGDILTRVAIPRSGSFLNTGGLTRYKSRAARRQSDKPGGGGGGGGSPLGFSELFNEFRLNENLHSLDDILYAIIDADGMSFNNLKPIYKEFLLKLAVTLTKDELFQRSKNIMKRQKKKKLKKKTSSIGSQKPTKTIIFGSKSLKKVFQLGQFRSCRGKPPKPPRHKEKEYKRKSGLPPNIGPPVPISSMQQHQTRQRSRVATSGSDVSGAHNENTFRGINRNSSSGYVSCSECSYDSEACTCKSADRCYCSLRTELANEKRNRKNKQKSAISKSFNSKNLIMHTPTIGNNINRHSLISCKSDDKCYCSMVEEELQTADESLHSQSDTTWCDTDSCVSASKCYCKRNELGGRPLSLENKSANRRQSHSVPRKSSDKLALDYELFTINGNTKPVQPHEALSVKKSVEAAAIFADVKLSQTTDIKSLCSSSLTEPNISDLKTIDSEAHISYLNKLSNLNKKTDSISVRRKNEEKQLLPLYSCSSQKSYSADDLLAKLSSIEKVAGNGSSIKSTSSKHLKQATYQSMRAVSSSLEDTLGYLP
ncbi:uncharacterized protein LOC119682600 [Teleopsis dalmanni]|uniref:uncharacterized protein LOC119682600 n=1 Tax=Teleopsis dalmanni TaxID=139649 RepID=UPI0018CFBFA6|nr:uncharacterized protein LOC119682600 [Teleopsis dalmanni]